MSRTEYELMAITCWITWIARNKCLFEAKTLDPQMSVVKVESLMEAYQRIKVTGLILRDPKEKKKPKVSQPPLQNWFKVNVDAAINSEKQMSGLRVLIRDSTGNVMADLIYNMKGTENEIYWVISGTQDKIKDLYNVKVQHILRSCNAIIHSLAKLTLDNFKIVVWLGSFAIEIMNVFTPLNEWKL